MRSNIANPKAGFFRPLGLTLPLVLFGIGPALSAPAVQTQPAVDGNTAFALDLYSRLKTTPGNLFFSPYSISTCLAMTCAGARRDTESQMARTLHFTTEPPQLHAAFSELQRQLGEAGKQNGIELSIANALWAQQGHPFLPAFLNTASGEYQANLNQADFKTGAEAIRAQINRWVASRTKDRIKDILPPGSLTGLTRLVLANAIYFKGAWAAPFRRAETSPQPFHITSARQVQAPLMHRFAEAEYLGTTDFQALELPYSGYGLSMVVLLPRQIEGCGQLENILTPELLSRSLAQVNQQRVEIFLPRFKLQSSLDLKGTLAAMGMADAFGPKADFSGIDGTGLLYISGVFHKAWGDVNEEGTEAAAATSAVVAARAIMKPPAPPPVFRADHPFIFLIRDVRSGSLLFLGRLVAPSS